MITFNLVGCGLPGTVFLVFTFINRALWREEFLRCHKEAMWQFLILFMQYQCFDQALFSAAALWMSLPKYF